MNIEYTRENFVMLKEYYVRKQQQRPSKEAQKRAQKKYREKVKDTEHYKDKQREYNRRAYLKRKEAAQVGA